MGAHGPGLGDQGSCLLLGNFRPGPDKLMKSGQALVGSLTMPPAVVWAPKVLLSKIRHGQWFCPSLAEARFPFWVHWGSVKIHVVLATGGT